MTIRDHFEVSDVMPLSYPMQEQKPKVWFRWVPNIDMGHVLTMLSFGAAFMYQWNQFDKRLTVLEEQSRMVSSIATEKIVEIKADVRQIKDAVGQMQTSMAVTAAKLDVQQSQQRK